jgi:hypothetical protein
MNQRFFDFQTVTDLSHVRMFSTWTGKLFKCSLRWLLYKYKPELPLHTVTTQIQTKLIQIQATIIVATKGEGAKKSA